MTKDEAIATLERVKRWVNKFPVLTSGATGIMLLLRDVQESLRTEAPTSEAVAEKPQGDRNAASPAAPAFQDGATASGWIDLKTQTPPEWVKVLVALDNGSVTVGFRGKAGWHWENATDTDCEATATHWKPWPDPPIGWAQSGNISSEQAGQAAQHVDTNQLLSSESVASEQQQQAGPEVAAQPAADPAPVPAQTGTNQPCINAAHMGEFACQNRNQCWEPCGELGHSAAHARPAQGIDHAKLAEGERAAFEAWAPEWFGKLKRCDEPGAEQEYMYSQAQAAWLAWQARGQQAGVPEGCVIVPKEPTEAMIRAACINQAIGDYAEYDAWWNSHSGGVSEKIRGYVASDYRAMIAAAAVPGEGEAR